MVWRYGMRAGHTAVRLSPTVHRDLIQHSLRNGDGSKACLSTNGWCAVVQNRFDPVSLLHLNRVDRINGNDFDGQHLLEKIILHKLGLSGGAILKIKLTFTEPTGNFYRMQLTGREVD